MLRNSRTLRWLGVLIVASAASGCGSPNRRVDSFAAQHSFSRQIVTGDMFRHLVLRNQLPLLEDNLHVYLEGDGRPFVDSVTIAADPTPAQPLMLHLMALDPQRAIYVGRPCYFGLPKTDAACSPTYWTSRRFSPEVVASLAAVIRHEMQRAGAASVDMFGHSGGGGLAVLLTRELPETARVITVAGNLDIDAWVRLHGYTPLTGSLNPAKVSLAASLALRTIHFAGAADVSVPPQLVRQAAGQIGGRVRVVPGYTHHCCWEKLWPKALLDELDEQPPVQ